MRKNFLIGFVMLIVSIPTFAGDYLTNTNQNAAFLRMIARGASIDIDGVYSNPAGLAFLPQNGLQVALTIQSAYQTRDIAATSPLWTMDGPGKTHYTFSFIFYTFILHEYRLFILLIRYLSFIYNII